MMNKVLDPGLVEWVSSRVFPFEAALRAKLRAICRDGADVDDVVQEVYCRLYHLESADRIQEPREYVMRLAKNIVLAQMRRDAMVDTEASAKRVALARAELRRVMELIAKLPERRRRVFRARRVYGLSIDATAEALGLSEHVIEKEITRGLALLSDAVSRDGAGAATPANSKHV